MVRASYAIISYSITSIFLFKGSESPYSGAHHSVASFLPKSICDHNKANPGTQLNDLLVPRVICWYTLTLINYRSEYKHSTSFDEFEIWPTVPWSINSVQNNAVLVNLLATSQTQISKCVPRTYILWRQGAPMACSWILSSSWECTIRKGSSTNDMKTPRAFGAGTRTKPLLLHSGIL